MDVFEVMGTCRAIRQLAPDPVPAPVVSEASPSPVAPVPRDAEADQDGDKAMAFIPRISVSNIDTLAASEDSAARCQFESSST